MGWKRTSGYKIHKYPNGVWLCDRCQRKMKRGAGDGATTVYVGPGYRASFYACDVCTPLLTDALRKIGFKFRLRPLKEEN